LLILLMIPVIPGTSVAFVDGASCGRTFYRARIGAFTVRRARPGRGFSLLAMCATSWRSSSPARPGPVVSTTKNSRQNIRGIDFIVASAHSGYYWARMQFIMIASRTGWPAAAPKA
jgi:hypothetical protein